MRTSSQLIVILLGTLVLIGCQRGPTSAAGFRLPDGDSDAGRAAFAELQCYDCHTVTNETFPESTNPVGPRVVLGGESTQVTTYGQLVTSIINPSHRFARGYSADEIAVDGESKMRIYNDVMTVQQLTDLVVFLQPHYEVVVPVYVYKAYPSGAYVLSAVPGLEGRSYKSQDGRQNCS